MTTLLLAQAFFGLCLPLNKMALCIIPPFIFVGIRLTVGGLLLLGHARLRGIRIRQTAATILLPLLPIILFGIVLKNICKYHALCHIDVAHVALLLTTTPLWTTLFSRLLLNEGVTGKQMGAILLGTIAATMYALPHCTTNTQYLLPTILLAVAIAGDAYSYGLLRKLTLTHDTPQTVLVGLRMLCGGLPLLALALASGKTCTCITIKHVSLLCAAIINGSLVHIIYLNLLKRYPAPLVALSDLLGPLFAVLFAWIMLQEQPTCLACVSGSIMLLALLLFQHEKKISSLNA